MKQEFARTAVKVGSNVLARRDGTLGVTRISVFIDQVAELNRSRVEIVLISSGVITSGRGEIHPQKKLDSVNQRQLFSTVGQAKLISRYYELFREHGIVAGQVLITKENLDTHHHYLSQKNCMAMMLGNGIIPIISENGTISVSEFMLTDNDELSRLAASMVNVQALIILSSIDGIYNGSPSDPASAVIREVEHGKDLSNYIQATKSGFGRGDMLTKTNIARKAVDEGVTAIIANGKQNSILVDLLQQPDDTVCTRFIPSTGAVSNAKKWIAHSEGSARGGIHINGCATDILSPGKAANILPAGITHIKGEFEKDDIVCIMDFQGNQVGVGKTNCDSAQAREVMGKHSKKPVVHYDYLYTE